MVGITSYGAYIPRYRINRQYILMGMGWFNPITFPHAKGEKAVANNDEDSLTMAVAAGRDCLKDLKTENIDHVYLASTTFPYDERQNSTIMAYALNLQEEITAIDMGGSISAGLRAVVQAENAIKSGKCKNAIVCAADARMGKMGSVEEHTYGDGAAALTLGTDNVIAEILGSYSLSMDFVDHRRTNNDRYDHNWEDRWIRDEGYMKIIPQALKGFAEKTGMAPADFAKVIIALPAEKPAMIMAKKMGFKDESVAAGLIGNVGYTGCAYAMMQLAHTLETASPGDKILMISFGNGTEVIALQVTDAIKDLSPRIGVSGYLARKDKTMTYEKYALFKRLITPELGIRGESLAPTAFSVLWRERDSVLAFKGVKCKECGTVQFPSQRVCANPDCNAMDSMEKYSFADKTGTIFTYTGDMLSFSYDPPAVYGLVDFDGGGRAWMDFTDCNMKKLAVGQKIENTFRRKYTDENRGAYGYFWKVMPAPGTDEKGGK